MAKADPVPKLVHSDSGVELPECPSGEHVVVEETVSTEPMSMEPIVVEETVSTETMSVDPVVAQGVLKSISASVSSHRVPVLLTRLARDMPEALSWTFCCMCDGIEYQATLSYGTRTTASLLCSAHKPVPPGRYGGCMGRGRHAMTSFLQRHGCTFLPLGDFGGSLTTVQ